MTKGNWAWVCVACGNEYPPLEYPPRECVICVDQRQFVPASGQRWMRLDDPALNDRRLTVDEVAPDLYSLQLTPTLGIGQRALFVRTRDGNVLWEPPGFVGESLVRWLEANGGIRAIASSHPHLVGASVSLSHLMGNVPVLFNGADYRWITRPDPVVELWSDRHGVVEGVELVQCGGHFPGSSVLLVAPGDRPGAILTGDTVMVGADRRSVSFMRSYPNLIPLSPRLVRGIADTLESLPFESIHGGFPGQDVMASGAHVVRYSADRYIGWITDTIRDPDDPDDD
ncbi:hydrolase [Rhodococcus sp. NPDC058521]|uniref:hydrolase n=1 Tax=Rhodococcus sp. NPDC058521 TaxID=3346536 RepID=UPI003665ED66